MGEMNSPGLLRPALVRLGSIALWTAAGAVLVWWWRELPVYEPERLRASLSPASQAQPLSGQEATLAMGRVLGRTGAQAAVAGTDQQIVLSGLVFSAGARGGAAVLAMPAVPARAVPVGGVFADRWRLVEVRANAVVLEALEGEKARLTLPWAGPTQAQASVASPLPGRGVPPSPAVWPATGPAPAAAATLPAGMSAMPAPAQAAAAAPPASGPGPAAPH